MYKRSKITPATQDRTMIKPGPADKVFTLAPHVAMEKIATAGEKLLDLAAGIAKFLFRISTYLKKEDRRSNNSLKIRRNLPIPVSIYVSLHLLHYIEIVKRLLIGRVWDEDQNFSFSQFLGVTPRSQPSQTVLNGPTDAEQTGIQDDNRVPVFLSLPSCLAQIEET